MVDNLYEEPTFINDGRKYILRDTCGLMIGCTKFPEVLAHPEDDYKISNGIGYGLRCHFIDIEEDLVVVMDDNQLNYLIKGLKKLRRANRKRRRLH